MNKSLINTNYPIIIKYQPKSLSDINLNTDIHNLINIFKNNYYNNNILLKGNYLGKKQRQVIIKLLQN